MEQREFLSLGAIGRAGLTRQRLIDALAAGQGQRERSDVETARFLAEEQGSRFKMAAQQKTELTPAAVLVPLIDHQDGLTVLLTRRSAHLYHHGGQISFPGGRIEAGDPTPERAALREAEEEVGLRQDKVSLLGRLDNYITMTRFHVVPVVGLIAPPLCLAPDPLEVAEIFEVPLAFILDPANRQSRSRRDEQGEERWFYAIPYQERLIWGATAAMLVNLCDRMAGLWTS